MRGGISRARRGLALTLSLVAAAGALAACGSSSGGSSNAASKSLGTVLYGTLPPTGTPTSGGTITQGELTGQTADYIFPITPSANSSTATFSLFTELWMPLYAGPSGARPQVNYGLSAANKPIFSNGDTVVTIPMKTGLHWSNGAPIDATDVVFWFDLLKAALKESTANWGQFSPGLMPQNVKSISTKGKYTVVMHLNHSWNPGFFLNNNLNDTNGGAYPLPSTAWNVDSAHGPHLTNWSNPAVATKIYNYLNKAGSDVSTFATNPLWKVVSGPFKLTSFSPTNSSYTLVPNPSYGGTPKPRMSHVAVDTYTSFTAELNAVKSGTLDVATGIDPSQLAEAPTLKRQGIDIYGGPGWGWFGGIYNFKDKTNHFGNVIKQEYVRAALAHLEDQPAIIKGVYKNAAVPAYGQTPSAPTSPYAPPSATKPTYAYSPSTAVSLLKSHGWHVVPNGTTTCAKPGTTANECGAGIPKGTPISFTWANQPESVQSFGALESEAYSSEAKKAAGINITLQTKTFNFLISDYNNVNPAAAKYTNSWGVNNYGGLFTDFYPTGKGTWDSLSAGFNSGSYHDPTATKLMDASAYSANPDAVKKEATYIAAHPPVLWFPDYDYLLAVNSKKVAGPPDGWTVLTQQQWMPQYWYVKK
jgi:peptide/nickel transport system substrate-binding protein